MNLERGFYCWVCPLLCVTDSLRANKRTRPCDKYCLSFYTVRGLYGLIPDNIKDSKLLPLSCSFLKCNWNAIITVEWVPPPTSSPAGCMGWIPTGVREESPTARTLLCHSQGFQHLCLSDCSSSTHTRTEGMLSSEFCQQTHFCLSWSVLESNPSKQLCRLGSSQTQSHSSSEP